MCTTRVDRCSTAVRVGPRSAGTGVTEQRWGPRPGAFAFAGALLASGVLWMFVAGGTGDRVVAGAVMVVVLTAVAAGLRMRDRLRASAAGLVVGTLSGKRAIPWSEVRRIEIKSHQRLGTVNRALEIDLANDDLLVFGRMDLGADPAVVAQALSRIRTGGI